MRRLRLVPAQLLFATTFPAYADRTNATAIHAALRLPDTAGVELDALDSGPGMADAVRSGRDGHSTTGTLGIGMGAIERLEKVSTRLMSIVP